MKTKNLIIAIVAAIVIIGAVYYLSMQYYSAPVSPSDNSTSGNTVNIQNFSFNPQTLTIKTGDTVTWKNSDTAPHQIKSTAFNSQDLSNGKTYSYQFNTAGTYDYSCAIHPSMTGKIIVQ